MKKFFAVLFAVMFALSGCFAAFAADPIYVVIEDDDPAGPADAPDYLTCDFCGATFKTPLALENHIKSTYPNADHQKVCENLLIDGDSNVYKCGQVFHSKAAYDEHQTACKTASDKDLLKAYFKSGDYANAFKTLFKIIVNFLKSDTFKNIINKVVDFVKGIDFGGIFNTVKGLVEKIPFNDIIAKVKGLF